MAPTGPAQVTVVPAKTPKGCADPNDGTAPPRVGESPRRVDESPRRVDESPHAANSSAANGIAKSNGVVRLSRVNIVFS